MPLFPSPPLPLRGAPAAPNLVHNPQLRGVLQTAGYSYDSSILEAFNSATSPSFAQRLFPYTLDNGVAQVGGLRGWPGGRAGG